VNINGFKQPESHPGPEQNHVIAEDHDANEEPSTQNQSLSKTMMPMKNPAPRIKVSAGWAYSACMPNGA